jgi:hypothetical protein
MMARAELTRRQRMTNGEHDPSDEGAPPGAPKPIKLSPEQLAQFRAAINEDELAEDLRAFREGRGLKLDQFIGELEELARRVSESTPEKG